MLIFREERKIKYEIILTVLSSVEKGRRVVEIFLALYKMVSLSAPRMMASSNNMAEKLFPFELKFVT